MNVLLNNNINSYTQKNTYSKSAKQNVKSNIAFSGGFNKFYNEIADQASKPMVPVIRKLVSTEPVQKFIAWSAKNDKNTGNLQRLFIAGTSCVLSGFYMINTARSKTIEKERKAPLLWNMGIVGVASTAGAIFLDSKIKNATKNYGKYIAQVNNKLPQAEIAAIQKGLNLGTKIALFAVMYRFIAPVIATPLASKAVNFFHNKGKEQKTDKVA